MKKISVVLAGAFGIAALLGAVSQDGDGGIPQMTPDQIKEMQAYQQAAMVGPKHTELAETVGTWDAVVEFWMAADAPPSVSKGKSVRTMTLGGRYMRDDFTSDMMGQTFKGEMMLGYNNTLGVWESNWCDNMSTSMTRGIGTEQKDGTIRWDFLETNPVTKSIDKTWGFTRQLGPGKERLEFWNDHGGSDFKMMQITYTKRP